MGARCPARPQRIERGVVERQRPAVALLERDLIEAQGQRPLPGDLDETLGIVEADDPAIAPHPRRRLGQLLHGAAAKLEQVHPTADVRRVQQAPPCVVEAFYGSGGRVVHGAPAICIPCLRCLSHPRSSFERCGPIALLCGVSASDCGRVLAFTTSHNRP
jgi:hypothetical protein